MSGQYSRERKRHKLGFSIDAIMKPKTPPLSESSTSSPDRCDVTSGRYDVTAGRRDVTREVNEHLSQREKEVSASRTASRGAEDVRRVRGHLDETTSPAAPSFSNSSNYIADTSFNTLSYSEQYLDQLYRVNSARLPGLPELPGAGYGLYSTSGLQEAAALHSRLAQYPYLLPHVQNHQHLSHFTWLLSRQASSCSSPVFDNTTLLFSGCRKSKRVRTAFSPSQLLKLENAFEKNHYVVGSERKELAKNLSLTETQVKVWFQNRRTKHKRVQGDDCLDSHLETTSTTPTITPMTTPSVQNNCESWDVEKTNYVAPECEVSSITNNRA